MALSEFAFQTFKTGQLSAFYAETYAGLITFAARKLGADYAFLAEDCVQDAIFATYENRLRFPKPAALITYVYASLCNRIVSVLRHEDVRNRYVEDSLANEDETSEDLQMEIIRQETLNNLFQAIDRLPDELRQIFEFHLEQGMTIAEVASRLNISEATVKRRKQQLIEHLRDDMLLTLLILTFWP